MDQRTSAKLKPQRDLLARAFLDILAREIGDSSKPLLRSGDPDNPIEKLLDDLSADDTSTSRTSIRPDLAAAAILTARAIEAEPGLVRNLRRGSPIITIATHAPDLVSLVRDVVKACAFVADTHVEEGKINSTYGHTAVVIARDGTANDHRPDKGNDAVAAALHAHSPLVGIAAVPKRHLPRDLMRAAECHLTIGQLDSAALVLVIEAVTGRTPATSIDSNLLRAVDIADLQLALRRDRTPEECLDRLAKVVSNRGLFDGDGPRLEDLPGYGEAKQWGLELAADLAAYRKGELDWASIEKGLLLAGPPGVGKTQFAKALAKTSRVPIVATSVADWNAVNYLSGTLQAMRTAFSQARRLAPAILFIDELDGISDRTTLRGDHVEYWSQIVNLLLELLAGVDDRPGVVVIGATNHPDKIDAAVRRAGRLDRTIIIEKPGVEDLAAILRYHLKQDLAGAGLMPAALAARGGTGADVEAWVRRARSKARRAKRGLLLDDLLAEIRQGQEPMPPALRRKCAIHEAGHIVVAAAIGIFKMHNVSIHDAGGVTTIEVDQNHAQTLGSCESQMTMLLGGRAAESAFFALDEVMIGAGVSDESDFARATKIAMDMEVRFGCGMLGVIRLPERSLELGLHDALVIAPVKRRLDACYERARDIVTSNKDTLLALANSLDERGYLDQAEIETVLKQHPAHVSTSSIVPAEPNVNASLKNSSDSKVE